MQGTTPLLLACLTAQGPAIVEALLSAGASPNTQVENFLQNKFKSERKTKKTKTEYQIISEHKILTKQDFQSLRKKAMQYSNN